MTDKNDIFSGDNPFQIFKRWLHDASKTEINDHDAIALSTVDVDGLPNVRMVLLRGIEDSSFVFLSREHYESLPWHTAETLRQALLCSSSLKQ